MKPQVTYNGLTFEPYITREQISERIQQLAREVERDSQGQVPLLVCVLNGAALFATDLFRNLDIDAEIAFIRLKSYEGTSTTGTVKTLMGLTEDIKDRTVILIEDIIDTGTTIHGLLKQLEPQGAQSIKVATLLFKPDSLKCDVKPDYVGFEIPSKFIVGYGLDLDGLGRNLNDIYVLKQ